MAFKNKWKTYSIMIGAFFGSVLSSQTNAGEYVVCKDVGNGGIKCEDGYYRATGESAEAVSLDKLKNSQANLPTFDGEKINFKGTNLSENTQNRIIKLIEEIKTSSLAHGGMGSLTTDKVIDIVAHSKTIESSRAQELIKELKESKNDKYSKPKDMLIQIARSSIMV